MNAIDGFAFGAGDCWAVLMVLILREFVSLREV
jgi:hypothetical protein